MPRKLLPLKQRKKQKQMQKHKLYKDKNSKAGRKSCLRIFVLDDRKFAALTFVASLFRGVDVNIGRIAYDFN